MLILERNGRVACLTRKRQSLMSRMLQCLHWNRGGTEHGKEGGKALVLR